ncbi:MAG: tRNA (adenosine(37)-N6)-threonylcarbamoyltransferase complex ATPase subunit type 1 TsaE [Planctomycetota bacterium]|jgi:tRNA threonylcarbamoyladenosine biosynthesis protein TsaE
MDFDVVSNSPDETIEIGRKIGSQFKGGEVAAVCGLLGSGKTHLIKGFACGLGAADSKAVTSPTFVIVKEYTGRFDIYHIDAYRIESVEEFEKVGFYDYCHEGSVVVIEWADKIESALGGLGYVRVELFHAGQNQRKIYFKNMPEYVVL